MKRFFSFWGLITVLSLSLPVVAFAGEQIGVYVQPKFVYGLTQIEGVKGDIGGPTGSISGRVSGSETDDAFGGSLAIGYDFSKQFDVPIRTELEYSIFSDVESRGNPLIGGIVESSVKTKIGIQTLFVNAYWDIDTGTSWQPYLTGGLGMAFIDTKGSLAIPAVGFDDSSSDTKTNFAWNLGLGIGYDINPSWTVDLGYRFVGLGTGKTGEIRETNTGLTASSKTEELYQHQFALGVRFTF